MAQRRSGAVAQWRSGAVAQWRSGAVAQWRSGAVAQWRSGAVAQWRSGAVAQWRSGAVAQWRSGLSFGLSTNRNRVQILCSRVKPWASCYSNSPSCMGEYLSIDSGGYVCTNSLRVLVAAWLDASQRNLDSFRLNRSARK